MKKRLFTLILAACLLCLTSCAEWEGPESDPFSDLAPYYTPVDNSDDSSPALRTFALPYFTQVTLDPITCPDGPHQTIGALLYEGLFALDGQFRPQPVLCSTCSYDAAALTYTISVRDGAVFSDGSAVTAADVVTTLQRARASARYAQRLADVESVSGSGSTITVTLRRPCSDFAARLDIPVVKAGTESTLVPLGSGRYVWRTEEGGPCLIPNENWWHGRQSPLPHIGLTACKDGDSVAYAFYSREIQLLACDLTGTATANVSGGGDYTDSPTAIMQYVGFNTKSELFANPALRSAIGLGLDRSGCVSAYLLGHGAAAQFPVSPASPLYPADLEKNYFPDDFAAAMAAAGFHSGTARSATMIVSSENTFRVQAARKIAEDLSRYDVKIAVSPLPWAAFQQALADGSYDLYYGECKLTADWDLTPLLGQEGVLNFSGYADPEHLDPLLAAAAVATEENRPAALRALCTYVQQYAPFAPVCFKNMSVLLPSGAVDTITPTAADPFRDLDQWVIHWAEE